MSTQSKYISVLYQTRSFSKAAKQLYNSQPALSMAVNTIEMDLGVKLFDRSTTPVRPTEACEYYLSIPIKQIADSESWKTAEIEIL